jgi:hypothetical protein
MARPKIIFKNNYLGIDTPVNATTDVTMAMAPVNSSGDIYHILVYLILSTAHGKTLPTVLLTYDGDVILP